jgi:hypothetical protein
MTFANTGFELRGLSPAFHVARRFLINTRASARWERTTPDAKLFFNGL